MSQRRFALAFSLLLALQSSICVNSQQGDAGYAAVIQTNSAIPAMYSLDFQTDPAATVGSPRAFNWASVDPADTLANQAIHKGVAILNGTSTAFVDMNSATSANSAGPVMPQFGGVGMYPYGDARQGWSFEVVFKIPAFPPSGSWSKLWFLGNGAGNDDVCITYDGGDKANPLALQHYSLPATFPSYQYGLKNFLQKPLLNTWYHVIFSVQAVNPTLGSGNWFIWVNGQQLNWTGLVPGAIWSAAQGALYPQSVPRTQNYLGKSDFSNDPNGIFTIDTFRVYNYTVSNTLAQSLAALYGLNIPVTRASASFPSTTETTQVLAAVPAPPIFHLTFGTDPTSAVGGAINYRYLANDPSDPDNIRNLHNGLVSLNGSASSFIDLDVATGPNSCGMILPRFGGTGVGSVPAQPGLTFEMVVKVYPTTNWGKLFCLGDQANVDVICFTWDGNNGEIGWLMVQNYNQLSTTVGVSANPTVTAMPFLKTVVTGAWYHFTLVIKPVNTTTFSADWFFYVNGNLTANMTAANGGYMPLPVYRPVSMLGGSDWSDPPAPLLIDAFRIYDYALTQQNVQAVAAVYGLNGAAAQPPTGNSSQSYNFPATQEDNNMLQIVSRPPVFNAGFGIDPSTAVGVAPGTTAYTWLASDSGHSGVVKVTGDSSSFVDLTTSLGPTSCGLVLPLIGGQGFYPVNDSRAGWTIELVFRVDSLPTGTWPKVFSLGSNTVDDILMSFNGGTQYPRLGTQMYNNNNLFPVYNYAFSEFVRPVVGQWYHVVWSFQSTPVPGQGQSSRSAGAGVWWLYLNGQPVNNSGSVPNGNANNVYPNAFYAPVNGALYPQRVPRTLSYLGKSDFTDNNFAVSFDAFRVYDYVVEPAKVPQLAASYSLNIPPQPVTLPSIPVSSNNEENNWSGIVPRAPIFNAVFGSNPAPYVGGTTNYQWMATDTTTAGQTHTGVIVLNGTASSYVDLNAATGPFSIGQVLPIFGGRGSGNGGGQGGFPTIGVTIETVLKINTLQTWTKFIDLGQGGGTSPITSLALGWDNNSGKMSLQNFNSVPLSNPANTAIWDFFTPTINQWYHVTAVMRPQDQYTNYTGFWSFYVNGVQTSQMSAAQGANYPMPVYRMDSYLGASDWSDPTSTVAFDMIRIYDYALTGAQVRGMSNVYGMSQAVPSGDSQYAQYLDRQPVWHAEFGTNPAPAGTTPTYSWSQTDSNDDIRTAAWHQGVLSLDGTKSQYIDLNAATGPSSVGAVLTGFGSNGNYPLGDVRQGWSFEFVVKFTATSSGNWAKMIELGSGPALTGTDNDNSFTIGWWGAQTGSFMCESYNNFTATPLTQKGIVEFLRPTVNTWYHIVFGIQKVAPPAGNPGAESPANWFAWVNGQQINYADALVPGALLTAIQGANYPLNVPRPASYIGKSDYSADPYFSGNFDAIRIYDYLLNSTTVANLATAYGLNIPNPPQVSAQFQVTDETQNMLNIVPKGPIFVADFTESPYTSAGVTNTTANYLWAASDPSDSAAVAANHPGVLILNGGATNYIDLSTTQGPNSVGLLLPVFGGAGSGNAIAGTQGLTIEITVKLTASSTWSKIFDIGTGPGTDSLSLSWNGNQIGTLEIQTYTNLAQFPNNIQIAELDFLTPVIGSWYHIVLVQSAPDLTRFTSTWTVYVNGIAIAGTWKINGNPATTTIGNYPPPITRQSSFIAASEWTDPTAAIVIDSFRIYDYVLSPTVIGQLATLKGLYNAAPTQPTSVIFPQLQEDLSVLAAVPRAPVFNASFSTDPTSYVLRGTGTLGYQWVASDSAAPGHTGLIYLSGAATSYVDMTTNQGPNSCGLIMPMIGGSGFYPATDSRAGWSIELVVKFTSLETWGKVINLGNGSPNDDILFSWDGNDLGRLLWENYNNVTATPVYTHAQIETGQKVVLNTWYHIVLVFQPVNMAIGSGNWFLYINGQQLSFADKLVSGAVFTALQGANYPLAVQRPQSYLGKSSWGADPNFNGYYDAVRVYDYALSATTVTALAAIYQLAPPAAPQQVVYPTSDPEYQRIIGVVPTAPIFNMPFVTDPRTLTPGATTTTAMYSWLPYDSTDSAGNQTLHKGLLSLNTPRPTTGIAGQYVDLSQASGPYSIGVIGPVFGGPGSGTPGVNQGVTFEMVVKLTASLTWSKLIDFGTGPSLDSFAISWYASTNTLTVENYNLLIGYGKLGVGEELPFTGTVPLNTWMHIAVVMVPTDFTKYTGSWTVYVNGQVAAVNATKNYPLPITRGDYFIGASDWTGDANTSMLLDCLRIYDYALTAPTVQTLASQYGLGQIPPSSSSSSSSSSSTPASSAGSSSTSTAQASSSVPSSSSSSGIPGAPDSSSSSLSGGAIAGAVVGAVVGALILCGLCAACMIFGVCGASKSKGNGVGKELEQASHRVGGGYGQMEPSAMSNPADEDNELTEVSHDGETNTA